MAVATAPTVRPELQGHLAAVSGQVFQSAPVAAVAGARNLLTGRARAGPCASNTQPDSDRWTLSRISREDFGNSWAAENLLPVIASAYSNEGRVQQK
jgi:hypothetical protein